MADDGEAQLTRAMEGLEFVRRRGKLTMPLEGEFYAWVGTNVGTRGLPKGWCDAHPNIGIGHKGVSARLAQLYDGMVPAKAFDTHVMLMRPLYAFVPGVGAFDWRLTGGDHPGHDADVLAQIVHAIEAYGMPWVWSLLVDDAMVEELSRYYAKNNNNAVDWVLYLEVTGRHDEAIAAREQVLGVYGERESLALKQTCIALRRMDEISLG